ncbi:hypothetical protein [Thermus sp.]
MSANHRGLAPLEFLAKLKEEGVPTESQMCWPTTRACHAPSPRNRLGLEA